VYDLIENEQSSEHATALILPNIFYKVFVR
jgi:hypothetical protein